jgi:hypothetical protein
MSKKEDVLNAVKVMIETACPQALVVRNQEFPDEADRDFINVLDGEPGEPEVDLSPLTYNYQHKIQLEVLVSARGSLTKEQVLDVVFVAIGNAILADRTLGGTVGWLDAAMPQTDNAGALGTEAFIAGEAELIAHYATPFPMG